MSCCTSITTQPLTVPNLVVTVCPIVKLNKADTPIIAKHLVLSYRISSAALLFVSSWAPFPTSAPLLCSSFEDSFYDLRKTLTSRHGEGGMIVSRRGK